MPYFLVRYVGFMGANFNPVGGMRAFCSNGPNSFTTYNMEIAEQLVHVTNDLMNKLTKVPNISLYRKKKKLACV